MKGDIFLLVDGSAIVHRAYHAMPPLTTSKGLQTGAIHGFFSMLLKVIHQLKPKHIAIAFDRPTPTFRKQLYVGYQANRPKMESELSEQFEAIIKILVKANIPVYAVDGFEADDVIGTISELANKKGEITYIVTGDRDMMQLVDSDTKVLMPIKGISEVSVYDAEKVREKFGINPDKIVELKALMGDASDNYPGVAGVGPKTAATLIDEYGTVDNVYKNIDNIASKNPKLAQKLIDGAEAAALAKKLAKILTDVPFTFNMHECEMKNVDANLWKDTLSSYEMKSLPKRIDEVFGSNGEITEAKKNNQMKLL